MFTAAVPVQSMARLGRGRLRDLLRMRGEGLRVTPCCCCCSLVDWDPADFRPKKAVVLTKVSRYEFEKLQQEKLSEPQLEEMLTKVMQKNILFISSRIDLKISYSLCKRST